MATGWCPAILAAVAAFVSVWQNDPSSQASPCRISGQLVRVRELPEGSGVAASRRTPGVFWAHNDSGDPIVFALDQKGSVTGRIRVAGAQVDDVKHSAPT